MMMLSLMFHDKSLIIWFRFPGLDRYSSFRAMAYAGTKAVTHKFAYQPYLTINYLQCTLVAVWNTLAAAIAKFLINFQNIPFHIIHIYKFSSAKLKKYNEVNCNICYKVEGFFLLSNVLTHFNPPLYFVKRGNYLIYSVLRPLSKN